MTTLNPTLARRAYDRLTTGEARVPRQFLHAVLEAG
jgi:hypothetical protein